MKFVKKLWMLINFIFKILLSNFMLILLILFGVGSILQNYFMFGLLAIISTILAIAISYMLITSKHLNNKSKDTLLKKYLTNEDYLISYLLLIISADIFDLLYDYPP